MESNELCRQSSVLQPVHTRSFDYGQNNDNFVRHSDLWFLDGSVVLRAEDMLFRVHMSQLARKSQFFRDMFALPQPSPPSTSYVLETNVLSDAAGQIEEGRLEDCPVIHLHDSAHDLECFLKAMYDGPHFGSNHRHDFPVVAGILRLSTKYFADALRLRALEQLSKAWPSTLRDWDTREDLARAYESEHGVDRGHVYPSPIDIINLAREVDAPSLLSSAFYDLSRYHFTQIYEHGHSLALGPAALSPPDTHRLALGKEASHSMLTALIQALGHVAVRPLAQLTTALGHNRRRSSGASCATPTACRKDFDELVALATQHYLLERERGCTDPLYVAEELGQLKSAEVSECAACARALEAWAARERERIWRAIPVWFRLE